MTREHNCFDHLEYDSHEWIEPGTGEHCLDEWYRCTICFDVFTVPQVDRMCEESVAK